VAEPRGKTPVRIPPVCGSGASHFENRVSTDRQGKSGLGLEAQREAVMSYLNGGRWTLAAEFTEVESGKRRGNSAPFRRKRCRVKRGKR
jgi:hypothetical protein